ncbi:hypothetical protein SGPA1_11459 [Streptomyces misionensis JCM 4497]
MTRTRPSPTRNTQDAFVTPVKHRGAPVETALRQSLAHNRPTPRPTGARRHHPRGPTHTTRRRRWPQPSCSRRTPPSCRPPTPASCSSHQPWSCS